MRLIDGDALVDAMTGVCNIFDAHGADTTLARTLITIVDKAPTVGRWISVKDRLPEEHADEHPYEFEQYLCATVWNDVRVVGFGTRIGDDKQHFWSGNSIWDDWVTHWMPLPEPPKEAE